VTAGSVGVSDRPSAGLPAVLVVDDDRAIAAALRRVLEAAGYSVAVVESGEAAVDQITHHAFEVVVSDIQMPGMTGVDLLRAVRTFDLDVPVILTTGAPSIETAIEAVNLGALQYLPKPTSNKDMLETVGRACRLHRIARLKRDALKLRGEVGSQAGDRAGLETTFESALRAMSMAFQPIVHASDQRVFGYEALLRCSEQSLPNPGALLAAAERLGRLDDVGRRVRRLSAEAFESAPGDALLFVNLHPRDLLDSDLYDGLAPLTRIAPKVVLEVTERSTIDDVKDIQTRVAELRHLGFRIAVDDLGAGYAGLSSFAALEPEIVKLDMSLVRNVHRSVIRERLITSMTAVCKEMNMRVVAEGIEIPEESAIVRQAGCELLQGYLYARPGPPFPTPKPEA
jgi:EAL domain-containing protein (putative c-di-GMP-specific phosphodiesterase class I)/CheY-like chemotaxis protein